MMKKTQPSNINSDRKKKMKHNVTQPTKSDIMTEINMYPRSVQSANLRPSSATNMMTTTLNRAISKRKSKSTAQRNRNSILKYFSVECKDRTDANKGKVTA